MARMLTGIVVVVGLVATLTASARVQKSKITAANSRERVIAVIGDSVSVGVGTGYFPKVAYPNNSWITGSNPLVVSHIQRLQDAGLPVRSHNFAESGATIMEPEEPRGDIVPKSLAQQAQRVVEVAPDFITILMGGNDVCSWPVDDDVHTQEFLATITDTLDHLVANTSGKIMMLAIPDMVRLAEIQLDGGCLGCRKMWARWCPRMNDHSNLSQLRERVAEVNARLDEFSRSHPGRIYFFHWVNQVELLLEDISMDMLHPSIKGQRKIAEHTWQSANGFYEPLGR